MATITEDYVSFETAKLLSNKGFNEPTLVYAYGDDMVSYYSQPKVTNSFNIEAGRYPLPTLQMARKWLRIEYNIHIEIKCTKDNTEAFVMTIEELPRCLCRGISSNKYEQTCDKAIKYCLENLI